MTGSTGSKEMSDIADTIRQGSLTFLFVENVCLFSFVLVMCIVVSVVISWQSGMCYLAGVLVSSFAGFMGMFIATQANVRATAAAAQRGVGSSMRMAFNGGGVMGFCVTGVGLGGIAAFYMVFGDDAFNERGYLAAFGLGVQSTSLFVRVGGGIFNKAAGIGAQLVGKMWSRMSEDDARNPATIADNIGDNVSDVAGMGADLCGSFVGSIICSCMLGFHEYGIRGVGFSMWIASTGIISSIIGHQFVRCRENADKREVASAFRLGLVMTNAIQIGLMAVITWWLGASWISWTIFLVGLITGVIIVLVTGFFTSPALPPTHSIIKATGSPGGVTHVVIQGLSVGMISVVTPSIIAAAVILFSSVIGGVYGTAIASTGLLSCLAFTISTDAFSAIVDTASGIAEMTSLDVNERMDILTSTGKNTSAVLKGFSTAASLFTGISLINLYRLRMEMTHFHAIADPYAISGIIIGAMIPFLFSAMTIDAVSTCSQRIIHEVRRQLRDMPGIIDRTEKPDYTRLVTIGTASSIHSMIGPGSIALLIPICAGIWFKSSFLSGMFIANTACGFMLSSMMSTSGSSWDSVKSCIESGQHGGNHSEAHKTAMMGDAVGNPFKDMSSPSISILVKASNFTGVVLAPVFKKRIGFWWAAFLIFFGCIALFIPWALASPSNVDRLKTWFGKNHRSVIPTTAAQRIDEATNATIIKTVIIN